MAAGAAIAARQRAPLQRDGLFDTTGDEDLALRLQAEELAGPEGQDWPPHDRPSGGVAPDPMRPAAHGQDFMTDEEFAAMLQREEEAMASRDAGAAQDPALVPHVVEEDDRPVLSDEELARLLQQEEDEMQHADAGPGSASQSGGGRNPNAANMESLEGCLPFLSQVCGGGLQGGGGALVGCLTGLQFADCCSCGQVVTLLCALVGALLGAGSSNSQQTRWQWPGRRRGGGENDWYPDSSDDDSEFEPRGVDSVTIQRHSVGHVFDATSAGTGTGSAADGDQWNCMICMEPFANGDLLRTLPCLHRYHQRCADEWLRRSPECPICKNDITELALPPSPGPVAARLGSSGAARPSGTVGTAARRLRRLLPGRSSAA